MDKFLAKIRTQHNSLIEAYKQHWQAIRAGNDSTPSQPPPFGKLRTQPARGRSQDLPPSGGERGAESVPKTELSALEPNQAGVDRVSRILHQLADGPEAGETEFAQNWVADALAQGIAPATLQADLTALEQALMPLATTLEEATFLWQMFAQTRVEITAQAAKQTSLPTEEGLQEAVHDSESRYRQILDAIPQMVLVKGDQSKILWANRAFRDYYGMSNEELQDLIDAPFNEPDYTQQYIKDDAYVFENGRILDIPEEPVTRHDGHVGIFHTIKAPIFDDEGNVQMTVGVSEEITERKRAEQRLRHNETRLAQATAIAKLYQWEFDFASQQFIFSPEYYQFLGIQAEVDDDYTMPAMQYAQNHVHPDDAAIIGQELQASLTTTEEDYRREVEARNITTDGQAIPVLVRFRLVRDEQGNPVKWVGVSQDITEQKKLLQDIEQQVTRLAKLNELSTALNHAHSLDEIHKLAGQYALDILDVDRASMALVAPDGQSFEVYGLSGLTGLIPTGVQLPLNKTAVGLSIQENRLVVFPQEGPMTSYMDTSKLAEDGIQATINAPLMVSEQVIGSLNVGSKQADAYGIQEQTQMQQLASLIASAIQVRQLIEQTQASAEELQTVAEISTRVATTRDVEALLQEVVDLTKARFGLYHAHIYLLNDAGDTLDLVAGADEAGRTMVSQGWSIPYDREHSLVAQAARRREGVIANEVQANPDFMPNPLLPETRSEMAIPIFVGDRLVGVLDVQADIVNRFTEQDVQIKTTLASQVGVALDNARLLAQVERALADVQLVQQQYIQEAWQQVGQQKKQVYRYDRSDADLLAEEIRQKAKELARQKEGPALVTIDSDTEGHSQKSVVAPVNLSGATIGSLQLHLGEGQDKAQDLNEDDLALLEGILDQVAQSAENFRLFEETREKAGQEQTIREVTERMREAVSLEQLVKVTAEELGQLFLAEYTLLELEYKPTLNNTDLNGNNK